MAAAEDVVAAAAETAAADNQNKRKLDDSEPEPLGGAVESESGADNEKPAAENDNSEAKRPRLDDGHSDVNVNGYEKDKVVDEAKKEEAEEPAVSENNIQSGDGHEEPKEASETVTNVPDEHPATGDQQTGNVPQPSAEDDKPTDIQQPSGEDDKPADETAQPLSEGQEPSTEVAQEVDEQQPVSGSQTVSRRIEVPNNKVGVLIGKAGDTIRYLQYNSGAKIQITRDADADSRAPNRAVELIGTADSISKAEKLIKDVIAEAEVGGSPSLVARGFSTVQAITGEQLEIQVPNEKVGLIIGKGGETIKNLQTKSGARIQLIPQNPPEGDLSKEKTLRITGDRKQIDVAREMIKEVMNQTVRQSPLSSGYGGQQGFRPRGPATPQWGHRGAHPAHFSGYDHQQRGPYPSQNQHYPPPAYGNYAPQSGPRGGYGPGWEQRPPLQGLPSQGNYNYGQSQGSEYGQPGPYPQQPPPQSYGHGYSEGHSGHQLPPYAAHGGSQQTAYNQGGPYPGYGAQDPYKPPSYGMPPQAPHAQTYGQPRANQPGTASYGPNVPPQQSYPYGTSVPTQQSYPAYSSAPAADGYSHPQPATASGPYAQQGGQPVSGYAQPSAQQPTAYGQAGAAGGYGAYPAQPTYQEQAAATTAGYGYQAPAETAYGTTPAQPPVQAAYAQPAPVQQGYDQSATTQAGAYGTVPAPAAYGKSVLPQPGYAQYDANQTYAAPR